MCKRDNCVSKVKKATEKITIKCSRKEDPLGGLQDFKEGITKDRVEQSINEMTDPVRGNRIERKSKQKDEGNLLLAEYRERLRVRGAGASGHCTA